MGRTVCGWVRVESTEMAYARAGRGAQLLLLLTGPLEAIVAEEPFRSLSREFRVVAPILEPEPRNSHSGLELRMPLRHLGEALGLERPLLVVDSVFEPVPEADHEQLEARAVLYWDRSQPPQALARLITSLRNAAEAGPRSAARG